ncbi:MAG: DUF4345 domain-containing protein [Alphaproteobacteria bacterium]|nr:DUF4345 domain-containing protein [Alphaproteobacteria bacterium]
MVHIFLDVVLLIIGLFYIYTGVASFITPHDFAKKLGMKTQGRSGEIEVRAQYGGFFFVAGLTQLAPLFGLMGYTIAYAISLTIFGGLILGRVGGALAGRKGEELLPLIRALYPIDGLGAGLAGLGLYLSSDLGM